MPDSGEKQITAVVFSSDLILLGLLVNTLKDLGVIPTCTNNPAGYLKALINTRPDFTVCDIDGIGAGQSNEIQTVFQEYKDNAILIVSAGLNDSWQSFLTQVPCLQKPLLMAKFLILVNSIVQSKQSPPVPVSDETSNHGATLGLVAVSQQMINTCQEIECAGRTRLPVMIHGEPGTEAEDVARAIHRLSGAGIDSFIMIYCAELPNSQDGNLLLDQASSKDGDKQLTTLYLHGIDDMPLSMQGKLMRFLHAQRGGQGKNENQYSWLRFVASSAKPKDLVLKEHLIRSDVYHMLSVLTIELFPLRDRKQDIVPLLKARCKAMARGEFDTPEFTDSAIRVLVNYNWPCNVIEVENLASKLLMNGHKSLIEKEDLPTELIAYYNPSAITDPPERIDALHVFENNIEQAYVSNIIEALSNDKEYAAEVLGISVSTLYRKIENIGQGIPSLPKYYHFKMPDQPCSLKDFVYTNRLSYIQRVLEFCKNDKAKAAAELGISLANMYRLLLK